MIFLKITYHRLSSREIIIIHYNCICVKFIFVNSICLWGFTPEIQILRFYFSLLQSQKTGESIGWCIARGPSLFSMLCGFVLPPHKLVSVTDLSDEVVLHWEWLERLFWALTESTPFLYHKSSDTTRFSSWNTLVT